MPTRAPACLQFATNVRYNSQAFARLLKTSEFPAESRPLEQAAYDLAQTTVNKVKFRKWWDAELRASVYLNEFLTENTKWKDALLAVLDPIHAELKRNKGQQLRGVLEVSDEREERFLEIVDQDGEGVLKYSLAMLMIDAGSAPATYQLIRVGRRVGEVVVMCLKYHYREARPSEAAPRSSRYSVLPCTRAFSAGHALQSHLISMCLSAAGWSRNQPQMLFELSRRISENRVIAGLHYVADIDAGVEAAKECFNILKDGELFKALMNDARRKASPSWRGDDEPDRRSPVRSAREIRTRASIT